jgi:hypothetical protein
LAIFCCLATTEASAPTLARVWRSGASMSRAK